MGALCRCTVANSRALLRVPNRLARCTFSFVIRWKSKSPLVLLDALVGDEVDPWERVIAALGSDGLVYIPLSLRERSPSFHTGPGRYHDADFLNRGPHFTRLIVLIPEQNVAVGITASLLLRFTIW